MLHCVKPDIPGGQILLYFTSYRNFYLTSFFKLNLILWYSWWWVVFSGFALLFEFAKSPAMHVCVPTCWLPRCANVFGPSVAYQRAESMSTSHFYVPTCKKSCRRALRRSNISTWHANVPKSVLVFQTFLLRNAKGNFYNLLLYKKFYIILDIILINIMCKCIVHINCIILYFLKLFCSLVRNGNIKRPGFYTLQARRVFSNFPQQKQLSKIKNTCEYCGLFEFWSAWDGDPG